MDPKINHMYLYDRQAEFRAWTQDGSNVRTVERDAATSQGTLAASEVGKSKEMLYFLEPPNCVWPCDTLISDCQAPVPRRTLLLL